MSGRLGELLVRENLISVQQLRKAQEEQQKNGTRIGTALIKTGAIEESKLTDFLSKQYGVPAINLKDFDIDAEIIKLVPKEVAEKHLVIPVNRAGPSLIVAMCDPSNIYAVDDLKFLKEYGTAAKSCLDELTCKNLADEMKAAKADQTDPAKVLKVAADEAARQARLTLAIKGIETRQKQAGCAGNPTCPKK